MDEIIDIIHKTIFQFFDVCGDDEEVPMSEKDKLLLKVNKAICNNLKALEQEPCEDCISRKFMRDLGATCIAYRNDNQKLIPIISIDELPSVKPIRKRDDVDKIKDLLNAIKAIAGNLEDLKDYENIEELCNDIEKVVTK